MMYNKDTIYIYVPILIFYIVVMQEHYIVTPLVAHLPCANSTPWEPYITSQSLISLDVTI